jgi:hypothetical protein
MGYVIAETLYVVRESPGFAGAQFENQLIYNIANIGDMF